MASSAADILTWSRILSIVPISIAVVLGARGWVLALYLLASASDLVDGPIARLQKTSSERGAVLDGWADAAFLLATLAWLHFLFPGFYAAYGAFVLIAALTYAAYVAMSLARRKTILMPHRPIAKAQTLVLGSLIPVFLVFGVQAWLVHPAWLLAVASRFEAGLHLLRYPLKT